MNAHHCEITDPRLDPTGPPPVPKVILATSVWSTSCLARRAGVTCRTYPVESPVMSAYRLGSGINVRHKGCARVTYGQGWSLAARHAFSALLSPGEEDSRVRRGGGLLCLDKGAVRGVRGGLMAAKDSVVRSVPRRGWTHQSKGAGPRLPFGTISAMWRSRLRSQ